MNSPRNDAPDYLAAFRAETPGRRIRRRNWQAIERRLEALEPEEPAPEPARPGAAGLRRLGIAAGLAFAIAAAVLLAIQGLGRGLMMFEQRQRSGTEAVAEVPTASPRAAARRRPEGPSRTRSAPTPPAARPTTTTPPPDRRPAIAPPSPSRPTPTSTPASPLVPPPTSPDDLAAETQLMLRAREAMANDDLEAALEPLEAHAARFPTGVLEPERRAYETIVGCRRDPEHATATEFLERYPTSPLRPRVIEACTR